MKFILTKELGRLARWLRLLGFDAAYFDSDDMKRLFTTAFNEKRIIITKRRQTLSTKSVKVLYVQDDLLKDQFAGLSKRLNLSSRSLFTRCADCNQEVSEINRNSAKGLVPPYVFKTQDKFFQCPSCEKIFWKATHWDRAKGYLNEIRN
jgi:uncharacterized protein with PIN domain